MNKQFKVDKLDVEVFPNRDEMGRQAANDAAAKIAELLSQKEYVNIILGSAPSQDELYKGFLENKNIEWNRINVFHMDEYIGIDRDAPQAFAKYLKQRLIDLVPVRSFHAIDTSADPDEEATRYSELLKQFPPDVVCLGIGENGHIAFNDPPVADFNDMELVKKVELEHVCRMQQVNDGCFASLDLVPEYALTLTVPALFAGSFLFCVVPAKSKAQAVKNTLYGEISTDCPASILRTHSSCKLYIEPDSASNL